jgi:4-amino-4-deoxy-L-arabinose transferase-like glycosyltransferase
MTNPILSSSRYVFLFFLLGIAYALGLFVPLMDNDAGHHANIALHIYQNNDFVNLIDRGGKDYLDKPHLLFWLSAISYYIFGVTAWAYKLPSVLFSIAAIWATYRLGKRLYDKDAGKLAALILASAQAFILACMDVRMDALLSSCIILATWQLAESVTEKKWYNILLSALFMALGFSTKGLVGIIMPGIAIFFYLLYKRDFKQLFHWKWIVAGLLTAVFMTPVVYCYYLQFDLHPEKTIRGMTNISGVEFILWKQNTERLEGKNFGAGQKDYFFYFHTMLWAFLPWCIITYYAIGTRLKELWKTKFSFIAGKEGLTIGTIVLIFILISTSRFQLPHYLNILFPFFSILTAVKLLQLHRRQRIKPQKIIFGIQLFIAFLSVVMITLLCAWCFPANNLLIIIAGILTGAFTVWSAFNKEIISTKIVTVAASASAFVNIMLNGSFYPDLLDYQGSSNLAAIANKEKIDTAKTYYYNIGATAFAFDFYTKHLTPVLSIAEIKNKMAEAPWVFTNGSGIDTLKQYDLPLSITYKSHEFHVTTLNTGFLDPRTRKHQLDTLYLVKIAP